MVAIKEIYLWTTKVRPEAWKPWANTLAYYKFEWNLNDSSGNGRNASILNWSASYQTVGWQQCFNCNNNNTVSTPLTLANIFNQAFTLNNS